MMDFLLLTCQLRTLRQCPAGFTVFAVLLNLNVPLPGQAGDRQVAAGLVAVEKGEQADNGQNGNDQKQERAFAPGGAGRRRGGRLRIPLLLFLFLLLNVEVIALRVFAARSAVGAERGVVAVERVAEGAVPVGIAADGFCLLLIEIFYIGGVSFFPGIISA